MKIIKKDLKKGSLTLKIENADDIWILSQVINPEDEISGKTERKIKLGDGTDRNVKIIKKWVSMTIKVEKTEIGDNLLRVLGVITFGPEDVARGEHHSFKLEPDTIFTIIKTSWMKYQIEKINEAANAKQQKIYVAVFDREEAHIAKLKGQGYEVLVNIKGDVSKKEEKHSAKNNFFKELSKTLQEYDKKENMDYLIVASPGFWKESLVRELPDELRKKTVPATVSHSSERALMEVLKRPELKTVLEQSRTSREIKLTDRILEAISKEKACYGTKETEDKVSQGAVEELMISYNLLEKAREDGNFSRIENMMKACEQGTGKVHVISSEEAKKILDSIAGVAGILRWKN